MATLFIRHSVIDYQSWRKAYDNAASFQKEMGVTAKTVYQGADDPNDITVTHDFDTIDAAQAFVKSEQLHKNMQGAGVIGTPIVWFANKQA